MGHNELGLWLFLVGAYNAFLWVLWSVILPFAFIVALRQWQRFNLERRKQERLARVKLAAKLTEAGIESDFKADDMPMFTDKDRHASCLQRLDTEIEMHKRLAGLEIQSSPQQDNEMPPQ